MIPYKQLVDKNGTSSLFLSFKSYHEDTSLNSKVRLFSFSCNKHIYLHSLYKWLYKTHLPFLKTIPSNA